MKKLSKTIISLLLCLVMLFSAASTAFAAELVSSGSQIPVIMISGDGAPISDENDQVVFQFNQMLSSEKLESSNIFKSLSNILVPYITEGLMHGNFDNYYDNIEKEIGKLFEAARLNRNGEADNGTGLDGWRKWCNWDAQNNDHKGDKGYYGSEDYHFWYDWRLDPLQIADELNEYIENIKRVTGSDKVCIISMCLGTDITMAYISKYGVGSLHGVSFDGGVVAGAEVLSEPVSGKFNLDGYAITRFLTDGNCMDLFNIDEFIIDTVDLLTKNGTLDFIEGYTKATVYDKVKQGVTSALALSTFYTWPGYWAGVAPQDYETAKQYIFGPEGSQKRQEYAGLIEKLDNYDRQVRSRIPELLENIKNSGINIAVIAKYGAQLGPVCQSNDELGDQIASVNKASFGATTSTVYEPLSDAYIAERVAQGKGKYISPDKQIDASTCYFPDFTWFVKGARHSHWTGFEGDLAYTVITADRQLTIDDFDFSQFMVYNKEADLCSSMTKENCNTYNWTADKKADKSKNPFVKFTAFVKSFVKWFKSLTVLISSKLKTD